MKKIASLLMAGLMALALVSCSGKSRPTESRAEPVTIRVAGLTGPTTMGMVKLMSDAEANREDPEYRGNIYDVQVYGTAREVTPLLVQGELDAAAIPANLAATLYRKTDGGIQVAAVNTLGVLYVVQKGDEVSGVKDLRGKTIYTTGKGTTPEYILRYVLTENGIDPDSDVTIEYLSEAAEVGARIVAAEGDIVAMIPQPYVTAVMAQDEKVSVALDMTEEWGKISDEELITGVLVVRKDFVRENKEAFDEFLRDYKASCEYAVSDVNRTASLVVKYGILAREPVAKKALPRCNIAYMGGRDMKRAVDNYLNVLFERDPESVGGAMPGEDFYYMG